MAFGAHFRGFGPLLYLLLGPGTDSLHPAHEGEQSFLQSSDWDDPPRDQSVSDAHGSLAHASSVLERFGIMARDRCTIDSQN